MWLGVQVTWVAMIICILFFEMNLATALWTGLVVGIAYTMFARAMYRQQLAMLQREMLREHQQHLPAQRSPSGGSPRCCLSLNIQDFCLIAIHVGC